MTEMERTIELQEQNKLLRQQVRYWKAKFQSIQKEYKELAQGRLKVHSGDIQSSNKLKNAGLFDKSLNCKENQLIPTEESEGRTEKDNLSSPTHSNDEKELQTLIKEVQTFQVPKKEESQLQLSLITGCFLIEKRRSCNYNPIKHAYPCEKEKDHSSIYDAIYRFVFIDEAIEAVVDDSQGSRKNQIFYGSTYEDFHFVFDDYTHLTSKKSSNQFLREANVMRKQHVFGIVRPELLLINQQYYETEIAFGFTSQVPFYPFFRDLNRVIQQQIKLSVLNSQTNPQFQDRLDVINNIITNICKYSMKQSLRVSKFPINLSIDTPLCAISLNFSSAQTYLQDQLNCAQFIIQNYPKKKIIKILHYLLAQKSMVVICKTRKSLNQLFQIIKTLIQPLNWIFPIVYSYSSFYQPFLSSPLPILIGQVKREYYEDWEEAGYHEQDFLPSNDITLIKAQSEEKDSNQISCFEKRIKKCEKWIGKDLKEDAILKEKIVSESFAKKISENKLCYKLHFYVQQLLSSVHSKQEDLDDFQISFKQSQMLSYYRQDQHSQ